MCKVHGSGTINHGVPIVCSAIQHRCNHSQVNPQPVAVLLTGDAAREEALQFRHGVQSSPAATLGWAHEHSHAWAGQLEYTQVTVCAHIARA